MSTLNRTAFEKLIDEDIEWLMENTEHCCERTHIIDGLNWLKKIGPGKIDEIHEELFGKQAPE